MISPLIFWDAWLILCLQGEALNSLLPFNSILKDFQTGFLYFHLPRLIHYQGTHTHYAGRLPLIHMVMGLSLQAFWQKELILRRNFGYSRLETARTTEGGAQPPGLTMEKIKRNAGLSQFYIWIFSLFLPFSLRARSGPTIRVILNFSNQTLIPNKRG